jgi:DNA-binding NtrC family response regulator
MAKILLIDDDVDLIEANKAVLAARGHKVVAAYTADEARKALDKGLPDVAVIDVMMETDSAGFDLAREIHEKYPGLPAVILSGVREAKELPFSLEPDETYMPVLKFMEKPVAPADLADQIDRIVEG